VRARAHDYYSPPAPQFFSQYSLLVQSSNYVTKRQSLKLLGEILLDRTNFKVMTRYIANEENLKVMMNLLKDRSKNIQFEAFHVFKVGVLPSLPLDYGTNACSLACFTKREREKGTDLLEHRFPTVPPSTPSARSLFQNPSLRIRTHTHTKTNRSLSPTRKSRPRSKRSCAATRTS
jgi:hypothetical protein